MTTNIANTLEEMRKRNPPQSVEAMIFAGETITQEKMDAIQKAQENHYLNRDRIPESLLPLCDAFVKICGKDSMGHWNQEPTQRVFSDWVQTLNEWWDAHLTPEHIQAAFIKANSDQGFPVGRPGALTVTAIALKTKMNVNVVPQIDTAKIDATLQAANAKWNVENFQPVTAETREKARAEYKAKLAIINAKHEAERRTR